MFVCCAAFYFYNLCDCTDPAPKINGKPNPHMRRNCTARGSPIPSQYLDRSVVPGTCQSYEDTLLAVDAALKAQNIPYGSMLLDSWWYGENIFGGASLWEDVPQCVGSEASPGLNPGLIAVPDPDPNLCPYYLSPTRPNAGSNAFPRGLKAFQRMINKTLWAHNGEWTDTSPYRKQYPFGDGHGLPQVSSALP